MSNGDRNYVSFWFWFLAIFVTAIPCVGLIMIFVWAFVGENESRKNYFRALIVWGLIMLALWVVVALVLGFAPAVLQQIEQWAKQARPA